MGFTGWGLARAKAKEGQGRETFGELNYPCMAWAQGANGGVLRRKVRESHLEKQAGSKPGRRLWWWAKGLDVIPGAPPYTVFVLNYISPRVHMLKP